MTDLLSRFKCAPNQADRDAALATERQRYEEERKSALLQQQRRAILETTVEEVFDKVTELAGGAPTRGAAGLIWQMVMDERLPCEGIAQVVIDKGLVAVDPQARIDDALDTARRYGGIDGAHHKDWTIDQMCRVLAGEKYRDFVKDACDGLNGPDTFDWDVGTPP